MTLLAPGDGSQKLRRQITPRLVSQGIAPCLRRAGIIQTVEQAGSEHQRGEIQRAETEGAMDSIER